MIEHRQSVLRAYLKRHSVRRAESASVRATRQPPSNGGIRHQDGRLGELGAGGDECRHAASIRLDTVGQDVAVSAAIQLVVEDFLGCNRLLSAPQAPPATCHGRNPYVSRGGKGGCGATHCRTGSQEERVDLD